MVRVQTGRIWDGVVVGGQFTHVYTIVCLSLQMRSSQNSLSQSLDNCVIFLF